MSSLVQINAINLSTSIAGTLSRQEKKQASKILLGILRAAVCVHQGEIAQQFVLGGEYHKRLRIAVENADKNKIDQALTQLDRFHLDTVRNAWKDSVRHLTNYFLANHKSQIPPRFCIKAVTSSSAADQPKEHRIVDLLREDGHRSPTSTPISENSGFAFVADKGTFYIENDIPQAVKMRGYKNSRLNPRYAADYRIPSKFSPKYYKSGEDAEWMKCWDDRAAIPPMRSCYKSTVILPMTLAGNSLREEFFEDTLVGQGAKVDRSIYGFLCFDHPNKDYFHEADIDVGYIFADLLSIYRITSDALISKSSLYYKAKNAL